jgi:biopolymer transport protein ExbB
MDRKLAVVTLLCGAFGVVWSLTAFAWGAEPPGQVPSPLAPLSEAPPDASLPQGPGVVPDGAAQSDQQESAAPRGFFAILRAGGLVGLLIILLSIAAVALVIEHIMTIRAQVLMPPGLDEEVRQLLAAGRLGPADQACQMQPSFLSFVLRAGFAEVDGGWPAVEKAMEDATAEQSSRLFRKIEYLSVIGNIAPMLGLLGTVVGMIFAFRELADSQGAPRAADLAEGIYLALVTTVEGLIVAIPSLAAFAVFRNRVDHLVAEVTYTVQHAVAPMKRLRIKPPRPAAAPPQSIPPGPAPPPVEGGM